MKYIDAEKLKAEIDNLESFSCISEEQDGFYSAISRINGIIDSLQQEQPAQKKNCAGCPHCIDRKDQYGWHFKGCFGGPYKGKFIAEIDECPLQQEQPDFPTTDEQMKEFLATHPKIEVPEKYKNPDWLFKKQEQPEADLEKEIGACWQNWLSPSNQKEVEGVLPKTEFAMYANHFYELGRQEQPEVFDAVAFQKGVQEGRRLEREDVESTIQSRIDEILGDAQPNPVLRTELNELIKKIEA